MTYTGTGKYYCGLLPTLMEGNARFQLEVRENEDEMYFPSVFMYYEFKGLWSLG